MADADHVLERLLDVGLPLEDESAALGTLLQPDQSDLSRLRNASRTAVRLTPNCSASSRSGGSLSPGRSAPDDNSFRMRSQISSKTRLGLIGPKSGILALVIADPLAPSAVFDIAQVTLSDFAGNDAPAKTAHPPS